MSVSTRSPEVRPSVSFKLLFELDRFLDLVVFELDELILRVTASMYVGQNAQRFLTPPFGNEPARRFWYEPILISGLSY